MAMSFWSTCTAALDAIRQGDAEEAVRLIKEAEAILSQDCPDSVGVESRREYLEKLCSFMDDSELTSKSNLLIDTEKVRPFRETGETCKDHVRIIEKLKKDKAELVQLLNTIPSIDPLCLSDPSLLSPKVIKQEEKEDFGIIVFGFTRADTLKLILESLDRQDALKYTEVWLDGHQGNHTLQQKLINTANMVKQFPVKRLHTQRGNYGFRKMLILGLAEMSRKYKDILILEDDCFPVRDAVAEFREALDSIRDNPRIFSVYGHHFLVESEKETCTRFQGWGWATTSEKLTPVLRQLIDCYSMSEEKYLEFVAKTLTDEIRHRIDVTPPRLPTYCLEYFFAWDETVCLLTALNDQVHLPTRKRVIYNCGMGEDSAHFQDEEKWRKPPFNLITPKEVWQYY